MAALLFAGLLLSAKNTSAQSGNQQSDTLTLYRKKIDELDKEIIRLFGERMNAAKAIGVYKLNHHLPVVQAARFNDVLQAAVKQGAQYGLSENFIKNMYNNVHEESIRQQEALQQQPH